MTKRKRRKGHKAPAPPPLSGPPPELATPRAKKRVSVEDPLLDWPEDELEADRWLRERIADDTQRD